MCFTPEMQKNWERDRILEAETEAKRNLMQGNAKNCEMVNAFGLINILEEQTRHSETKQVEIGKN